MPKFEKVNNVKELTIGDTIKILNKPRCYSSYLNVNNPFDYIVDFPHILTIKNISLNNDKTHHAMTCGNYGWDLESIVEIGCELLKYEQKALDFPFLLYRRNKNWYIKN